MWAHLHQQIRSLSFRLRMRLFVSSEEFKTFTSIQKPKDLQRALKTKLMFQMEDKDWRPVALQQILIVLSKAARKVMDR